MKRHWLTDAMVSAVHVLGRGLESLADRLEFFTRKKLSFVEAIAATVVIVGAPAGLLYYHASQPGYDKYTVGSSVLVGIAGDISHDLHEKGKADLTDVRKRFFDKWQGAHPPPPPLVWTEVEVILVENEYEGRIICYVPRRYFGRFARTTMCVALERDPGTDDYLLLTRPLKGPPDLIREERSHGHEGAEGY